MKSSQDVLQLIPDLISCGGGGGLKGRLATTYARKVESGRSATP